MRSNQIKYFCFILLIISSLLSLYIKDTNIKRHLPYIGHVDEKAINVPSLNIISSGDLNPKSFMYPSFPIYLNTLGFSLGFFRAASHGTIKSVKDIGSVSYPFYTRPVIVLTSKQIFALFSVLAAFLTGILAYKAFKRPYLIFLPPLLVSFSPLYMYQSWVYLNVDIIGAFFVSLSLTYIVFSWNEKGIIRKAVLPGILCGLCIASKYNLFLIYVPFFLAVILGSGENRILNSIVLLFASIITFIVVIPYSILDYTTFINHVGLQVFIYSTGHKGFDGPAGWPQVVFYIQSIARQYGWGAFVFSLIGLLYMFKLNLRNAAILCSFPIAFILFMSTKEVHFLRNMTSVYLLWPIFISVGLVGMHNFVNWLTKTMGYLKKKQSYGKVISWGVTAGLLIALLPHKALINNLKIHTDTRNQGTQWIDRNVKTGSTIIVPNDLLMDTRPMEKNYKVIKIKRKQLIYENLRRIILKPNHYLLVPHYGYDKRWPNRKRAAEALNNVFHKLLYDLKYLKHFDGRTVKVRYNPPVAAYSPKFSIAMAKT